MKKLGAVLVILLLSHLTARAQVAGCTDPQATNFNPAATYHDGSCTYVAQVLRLNTIASLPVQLDEISGLIYYNGNLYGHPDSGGGTLLYEISPATGTITKTINLEGTTNVDWEDITQDATHMYACDTGNNARGNRTDLKIYKFPKTAITAGTAITIPANLIETIYYSYEDQTDFSPQPANSTSFDCEAVAYNRGKLHLVTKNWLGSNAGHYVLPTTPGTYIAQRIEQVNTGNIKITGAEFGAFDELILIGYEITGFANCAVFLNYGFDGSYFYFNTGSKRRLDIIGNALSIGQVEAICFENALKGYIANERFNPISWVNVPPRLYTFDITEFIKRYYENNQLSLTGITPEKGMIRFNTDTKKTEGYDGTHWVLLEN